jgi:hypothetical protein
MLDALPPPQDQLGVRLADAERQAKSRRAGGEGEHFALYRLERRLTNPQTAGPLLRPLVFCDNPVSLATSTSRRTSACVAACRTEKRPS